MTAVTEGPSAATFESAYRQLLVDPAACERTCRAILSGSNSPVIRMLLASALRLRGDFAGAEALAVALVREIPRWAGAHFEYGVVLGRTGRHSEALAAFTEAERLGGVPGLWREVAMQRRATGDASGGETAFLRHLASPMLEPNLQEAINLQAAGDIAGAERAHKLHLAHCPEDVLAQRYLAELYSSQDRYDEAEALLRQCLERAPSYELGRYGLAMVLLHAHEVGPALAEVDRLLAFAPSRLEYMALKADALGRLGDFDVAARYIESILALRPEHGPMWANYGHVLRALGRRADCELAYKQAVALNSGVGEAYWGLANLKTYRFQPADIAAMRALLSTPRSTEDRTALLFALGKALEDERDYASAFDAYEAGNRERRRVLPYDHTVREEAVQRAKAVFTPSFFAERRGFGAQAQDPIFIVGMPRSGSTLVEQILASHSAVEGTMELIELLLIVKRLEGDGAFPASLQTLSPDACRALGEEYLRRAQPFRKTGAPRFIDKMPNNFAQVGLIHLILPNARIIDVRRDPRACGFSNFKQHWATGQAFSYDLADIGRYYRSYVELMAHFDAVLPGRVHRVIYEDLVASPEAETRRLLAACGLDFEESCLRFFENKRAVRTPSSEQVRQPVNKDGLDNWRPFEPWLLPLKDALGPVLAAYPVAPR